MKINPEQIIQIYEATQSKNANFKNLTSSERRAVETVIKALKDDSNDRPWNVKIGANVNIDNLVRVIKGEEQPTKISSIRKVSDRIMGVKSSKELKVLTKKAPKKMMLNALEESAIGNPGVMMQLGAFYHFKQLENKSNQCYKKAIEEYKNIVINAKPKSADEKMRLAEAHLALGESYQFGIKGLEENITIANNHLEKAMLIYKDIIENNPESMEAADAHFQLGEVGGIKYSFGRDILLAVPQNEFTPHYQEAFKLYDRFAKQGSRRAQTMKHILYSRNIGVKENPKEAFKYFRKSVKRGDVTAHSSLMLSECYKKGIGTKVNLKEWKKNLTAAALAGHPEAQQLLKSQS